MELCTTRRGGDTISTAYETLDERATRAGHTPSAGNAAGEATGSYPQAGEITVLLLCMEVY